MVANPVESVEVKGVDTIRGLVGEPPMEITILRDIVEAENVLISGWNSCHVAVIPYCFKCREPLIWINPPDKDGRIFKCDKCGRVWKLSPKEPCEPSKASSPASRS